MTSVSAHGGGCCGARHIHGFSTYSVENGERDIRAVETAIADHSGNANWENSAPGDRLLEIILNDNQCTWNDNFYPRELKRLGFRYVTRARNANHDSYINVFHYRRPTKVKAPFVWKDL